MGSCLTCCVHAASLLELIFNASKSPSLAEMLPLCPARSAFIQLRTPLAFIRNVPRRSAHSNSAPFDAAVIGAGITGLTTAYRLSKNPNCAKVTLYEKSSRIGGWLDSEVIDVEGGQIVFEYGPRTLRAVAPACLPLLDLLHELKLQDQILYTAKSSPASQNRYIYYPDHLIRLPSFDRNAGTLSNIWRLLKLALREPIIRHTGWRALAEPFQDGKQPATDESVASFISRRLSPEVADVLVSSVYHGILAGNIDQLSASALMGTMRDYERHEGNALLQMAKLSKAGLSVVPADDILALAPLLATKGRQYTKELSALVKDNSTLTLQKGVGQLTEALLAELNRSNKVEILTDAEVKGIYQNSTSSNLGVVYGDNQARLHNRLIATNSAPSLAKQLEHVPKQDAKKPHKTIELLRKHNYAVTMMVVNLYYPNPNLVPVRGFGYLIPRSIPSEQNPERALGVIFASESGVGQDSAPGTKLTVMLGGHWWDGWTEADYPNHDAAVKMAQSLLQRHLRITDTPTVTRTRLQRNAIPQPTLEHRGRMCDLSYQIKSELNKRVTLAGAWYAIGGTGVVDSVRQAYLATEFGVGAIDPNTRNQVGELFEDMLFETQYSKHKILGMWDSTAGGIPKAPVQVVVGKRDVHQSYY
ncbi:hypothetical protein ASPCAL08611 [Aspergillus calidoustus]|uniref:Protoporphyrinogen oxidase n=1 Tax=Aspergillus calidoustus TaxID=454130 RepID=A0A0U5CQT7_ASPCI|nr:hypothetical protein ASPCAL08611 [Aspergillus calidoustus]